ncbi:patatin-like phospholipase family protein [Flavihumibacter rivuli]|uniref:patatin-like phospholipase family protein n=1 Tax=Flavihumibacter rivuli TaxID=2838156 RepID=UPI001BDEE930|nr:patatin-like phospholipase family protein [Flavihumibacter rivuli]ULQ57654.1 patatin-like phospholipase family protein [Flavihumibacter rivuli]
MYRLLLLIILVLPPTLIQAQKSQRPKIGLTLSGGGAKGLAHIGILKAIDSAGLQIDYVTGTSMGAIVGSLYAIGYSGDSILQIARNMDWFTLLSNRSSLNDFIMEEKPEYGRYAVELPLQRGRFSLPSGLLESEELWLKFEELFFPAHGIHDFNKFYRPFKCIATDLATGEAVVLDKGDIISAVRSSMAIPSVFTAVTIDGQKLVDGGLIRNFPVSDVRKMGSDITIGSSVSSGLLSADKLNSPIQILMQIAFYKEAELSKKEVDLCDIYIPHPVDEYSSASFNMSDSIIKIGLEMGKQYYPHFKRMADSLNAIYGKQEKEAYTFPPSTVKIRHIISDSLRYVSKAFLNRMLGLKEGGTYNVQQLEEAIRQAYGTRYFSRLYYELVPVAPGVADMKLNVEENAEITAKLAINYTTFSNIMLIGNLSFRDALGKNSRSSVSVGLSENPRVRLEHTQVFGSKKFPLSWVSEYYLERQEFTNFANYRSVGVYREYSSYFDTRLQLAFKRKQSLALGMHWERVSLRPLTVSQIDIDGKNTYLENYVRYEYNSHDRLFLPRKGTYLLLEPSIIYSQNPDAMVKSNAVPVADLDSLGIDFGAFARVKFMIEKVFPIRRKHFITLQSEANMNFNTSQFLFHDFLIGGMQPMMRNQVSFGGLQDAMLRANSLVKGGINWRYQFSSSLYAAAGFNLMYHSFLRETFNSETNAWVTGTTFTLGVDSPIGPLEFSFMYSNNSKLLKNYVNLGYRFTRKMF